MEQDRPVNDDIDGILQSFSPGVGYTKELGELNYTNGIGTEHGFWKHAVNCKYYYQCGYFEQNADGKIFWCTYDQRTDHHREYKGVHVHKTKKPIENGPLDKHLKQISTHIKTRYQIYSKIAHFTATSNLSLKQGCSEELFQIIYESLDYYKQNFSHYLKAPNQQIIPKIGPEKIRKIMIETADDLLSQSISNIKYTKYISICLDGGQTNSRHFIDFVAWSKRSSFSVFIKDTQSLNSKGYADLALECLNHERLKSIQNKIVCFVGDGLRAQVAGIDPESKESFQHRSGIGDLSKIIFSPCNNHRLQNAFKKTYRENLLFKKMVNKVNKLAIFLRKPTQVKALKKICPEPIVTRWQYIFNITFFIQNNIECINRIISLKESNVYEIDFDLEFFLEILHPIRSATLVLSQNKCCLCDVYPIISAVIEQYKELKLKFNEENHKQVINALIKNIKYYTLTSPQQSLIMLSYVLTPCGRSTMFKLENGYPPENEENYVSFDPIMLPDLLSKKSTENETEEINIDALIDIVTEESSQLSDDVDYLKQNDDDAELEQRDENGSVYEKCRDAISKLIKYFKINILEHQNLYKRLREWINLNHDSIPFYELIGNDEEPMAIWNEILKTHSTCYQKWHILADIAIKLYSIPSTETNCERTISLQGFIAKDRSQRSKPDLLNARLIHLQNK